MSFFPQGLLVGSRIELSVPENCLDFTLSFSAYNGTAQKRRPIRPRGYKTFFMFNSIEHEILNAYKSENIRKFVFF